MGRSILQVHPNDNTPISEAHVVAAAVGQGRDALLRLGL